MQQQIIQEVKAQAKDYGTVLFGMQADEVCDVSNVEQLGVVLRYVKNNQPVERLVEFVACEQVTGAAICENLLDCLAKLNLDAQSCRAQTYDGAGNMAGEN